MIEKVKKLVLDEFGHIIDKIEFLDLLENGKELDYDHIETLKLPNDSYNIVWHPGVYVFLGNNQIYRVGVSVKNSRARVLQHIYEGTRGNGHEVCDINNFADRAILLINVKNLEDRHWLLSIEMYLEEKLEPLIRAKRNG